jgi:hypothetical protein
MVILSQEKTPIIKNMLSVITCLLRLIFSKVIFYIKMNDPLDCQEELVTKIYQIYENKLIISTLESYGILDIELRKDHTYDLLTVINHCE